ncbi:MAG: PTS transporter subunit EIIC [Fusobacterium sp. JB019]|nr:PTS transporter subunit EIIC [Fusobacterium sp. JB019]MDP0506555.1 PTS transporter subunit EIIC [Fusobacterium sp. JB019]
MKKRVGDFLQKLGKSLMMPISIIAAAGIFLGLAAALQNPHIVGNFANIKMIQIVIGFIRKVSGSLFGNLPILFAISVAIGLAKDEKPTAAFSAVIGFIVMNVGINYALKISGITPGTVNVQALVNSGMGKEAAIMYNSQFGYELGIFTYRTNVFGAIISAIITSKLHNKYYTVKLPDALNFFGGKRFVPIITVIVMSVVGVVMANVWPFIGKGIIGVGTIIQKTGIIGTFIFGFTERILIPTGLHHILNQTVRFTPIGGVYNMGGHQFVGALSIFNGALANPGMIPDEIVKNATRFLCQGKIPVMMFGLPAAAMAMLSCAKDESSRKRAKGLLIAGALASFATGITEPLEFAFIFISPILFLFHAVLFGLSFMLMNLFGVMIGNVQGGVIDFLVFGVLRGMDTNWIYTLLLGLIYIPVYYFGFKFIINKYDLATPGREEETLKEKEEEININVTSEIESEIIVGLGGKENIKNVDNCFTRLRVDLEDISKVDEILLKKTGAAGIFKMENHVQVIYGPKVEKIALDVKRLLIK